MHGSLLLLMHTEKSYRTVYKRLLSGIQYDSGRSAPVFRAIPTLAMFSWQSNLLPFVDRLSGLP